MGCAHDNRKNEAYKLVKYDWGHSPGECLSLSVAVADGGERTALPGVRMLANLSMFLYKCYSSNGAEIWESAFDGICAPNVGACLTVTQCTFGDFKKPMDYSEPKM